MTVSPTNVRALRPMRILLVSDDAKFADRVVSAAARQGLHILDKAQTIVKIAHSLGPWRTAGARGAVAALELPAGTAAALDLERGMALVLADVATS